MSNEGFRKVVNMRDKRYVIPSRNYFPKVALPELYAKNRGEHFGSTTNLWSSRIIEPYISLTVYYTDNFKMQNQSLQTPFYPQDQNEVNCLGTEGSNDIDYKRW